MNKSISPYRDIKYINFKEETGNFSVYSKNSQLLTFNSSPLKIVMKSKNSEYFYIS
ncbi:hypothetical protein [Buchnera aphidicola]|uniref:hypothetical protein n=1 Tax=Buchnera aphidicola TaxID=9 RepID=UPI003463A6C9